MFSQALSVTGRVLSWASFPMLDLFRYSKNFTSLSISPFAARSWIRFCRPLEVWIWTPICGLSGTTVYGSKRVLTYTTVEFDWDEWMVLLIIISVWSSFFFCYVVSYGLLKELFSISPGDLL